MNLAIRGIDSKFVLWNNEGSFQNDTHKDLKADYLLANPPFNDSDWKGEILRDDMRWKYGVPPVGNANFAWIQHFIHHLAPHGITGFALANGSMSSNTSNEGEIRKNIIIVADEAHRSQYGFGLKVPKNVDKEALKYGYAKYLRDALPNATFIAFTGTPIEKADRSTPAVFGKIIDSYDINQAVEDGSTVKIYYETALPKLKLNLKRGLT